MQTLPTRCHPKRIFSTITAVLMLALALILAACGGTSTSSNASVQGTASSTTFTATPATSDNGTPSPTATLLPKSEQEAAFDEVWNTVSHDYFYTDFHGIDWDALYRTYKPKALAARTSAEFYKAISDMVAELKDNHSRFLAPWEAREEDDFVGGRLGYVGVGAWTVPDEKSLLVQYVFPDSPAEKSGIKRRDRILAVDGRPFVDAQKEDYLIRGPAKSIVRLTISSPGQPPRDLDVTRDFVVGRVAATSSQLGADPTIAYLIVPTLEINDMDAQVEYAMLQFHRKSLLHDQPIRGLVIDLRGNEGGSYAILKGILNKFMNGDAGTTYSNNSYIQSVLDEEGTAHMQIKSGRIYDYFYNVPVVVLVDKKTQSAAELLAAVLQYNDRVKVVGTRSAGNTESVVYFDLLNGSRLWLAEAAFKLPDGRNLQGTGVTPDVVVDSDWTTYNENDDPQILKAVELIHAGLRP